MQTAENSVTITQPETGPEAPPQEVAQDNQSSRPEWLPEKFKSPEDMAKSYTELEKKMSSGNQQQQQEETQQAETPISEPQNRGVPEGLGKFSDEFYDKGELSEDSFSELQDLGYSREIVETYINGYKSSQAVDADAIKGVAGGEDGYTELTEWAKGNMATNELELYNQMVGGTTENAKMAVEWLMSKRESVEGSEPNLVSGRPYAPAKDIFRSTAEVTNAMKDKRYGKDPAYTKDVEEKLGRSNVF